MAALARYAGVSLDCDNPATLAAFYSELLGVPVGYSSDEFVHLDEAKIGFVRVEKYVPPTWPASDVPKQGHMEFGVDDLDEAERAIVALGATKPDTQPQPDRWRVLLDPAGHPFCISNAI